MQMHYPAESAPPAAGTVDGGVVQVRLEGTLSFMALSDFLALLSIAIGKCVSEGFMFECLIFQVATLRGANKCWQG